MSRRAGRFAATAIAVALVALVGTAPASAGTATIRIRQASLDPDGTTKLVIALGGDAAGKSFTATDFTVIEQGKTVAGITADRLLPATTPVAVALAIDISGSTVGKPLTEAKAAARQFVMHLDSAVPVVLVAFGAGARIVVGPTIDRAALTAALRGLSSGGGTALYDGVALAARTLRAIPAQRNIVVFTDGRDTDSKAVFASAVAAAKDASAIVVTVALQTSSTDLSTLSSLASQTGGRSVPVGAPSELAAAFTKVAVEIGSQVVLHYRAALRGPSSLDIKVSLAAAGIAATDAIAVLNPRTGAPAAPPNAAPPHTLVPFFTGGAGLVVGILAAFGFFALLTTMAARSRGTEAARALKRGLSVYAPGRRKKQRDGEGGALSGSAIGRAVMEMAEHAPTHAGLERKLQMRLERAGWPLRASEFLVLQTATVAGGAIVGFGLLRVWWLGIVITALAALAPRIVLSNRIAKRQNAFAEQLPQTLQLLAGSLQAGYGFLQAVDTLVQESQAPTSTEFSRVLSESRLGMPDSDALAAMADRIGSDDFRWVVLAINIQRQAGGNLAELLHTVAATLRERAQVRRQIKVLSAEGRLSAVILTVLPFLIAGYIMIVNPGYLGKLFASMIGKIAVAGAIGLMGIGIVWMRKIIRIDV